MTNEFSFGRLLPNHGREAYSISYDKLSRKACVYINGERFDLEGRYESDAAVMHAAEDFLSKRRPKL